MLKKSDCLIGCILLLCTVGCQSKNVEFISSIPRQARGFKQEKDTSNYLDDEKLRIEEIEELCNRIDFELDSFRLEIFGDIDLYLENDSSKRYSIEGSELFNLTIINAYKYYFQDSIKKIMLAFQADKHELISEYFVNHNKLICAKKKHIVYLKYPEDIDFDSIKDVRIYEERYYFLDKNIIGVGWDDAKTTLKEKVKNLLHDFNVYLTIKREDIGTLHPPIWPAPR